MEKQELKLDYIRITPELIKTVNQLQTGGTIGLPNGNEDSRFDNFSLKDRIDDITEVSDFIIGVYENSPELFKNGQFSSLLCNLRYLKIILNGLAAPQQKKQ